MPCNCKETRKVKTCPTVSVEETILTELRNFYDYVVAKFTALFALPALNTPEYEWRIILDIGAAVPERNQYPFDSYVEGDPSNKIRFNFTIPEGTVFMSVTPPPADPGLTDFGVFFPGNVCPLPDDGASFATQSAEVENILSVTAPAGGQIPPGLYSILTTNTYYNPVITCLVRT